MFEGLSLLQILAKGGVAVWVLGCLSFVLVGISINRFWIISWRLKNLKNDGELLLKYANQGNINELIAYSRVLGGVIRELTEEALNDLKESTNIKEKDTSTLLNRLEIKQQQITSSLYSGIWILGTMGNISPFIGLFGTVIGIMRAFGNIAERGYGGFNVVAAGIAEALVATAAGLALAILSVFIYNYFVNKISNIQEYLQIFSRRFGSIISQTLH